MPNSFNKLETEIFISGSREEFWMMCADTLENECYDALAELYSDICDKRVNEEITIGTDNNGDPISIDYPDYQLPPIKHGFTS